MSFQGCSELDRVSLIPLKGSRGWIPLFPVVQKNYCHRESYLFCYLPFNWSMYLNPNPNNIFEHFFYMGFNEFCLYIQFHIHFSPCQTRLKSNHCPREILVSFECLLYLNAERNISFQLGNLNSTKQRIIKNNKNRRPCSKLIKGIPPRIFMLYCCYVSGDDDDMMVMLERWSKLNLCMLILVTEIVRKNLTWVLSWLWPLYCPL